MAVYAITLAFCNTRILRRSIESFYRTSHLQGVQHFIVDQHYPLRRFETLRDLNFLKHQFGDQGLQLLDPGRNLGLHDGFNWALKQIPNLSHDDIIIGYDGDSLPTHPGWDGALVAALGSESTPRGRVVWASLGNPRTVADVTARGFDEIRLNGPRLWLTRYPITNSVCAWRYGWLEEVGFLSEPRAFYGHLEAEMFHKMREGERWAVLPDYGESDHLRQLHDREYTAYKWHHSHTQRWPGDFESYVKAGCPALDDSPMEIP